MPINMKCNWIEHGVYGLQTACRNNFYFEQDTWPDGFKYCGFCGKEIDYWEFYPSRDVKIGREMMNEATVPEYWENKEGVKVYDRKDIS